MLGRGTFTFDNLAMNLKGEIAPGGPTEVSVTPPPAPSPVVNPQTALPPPLPALPQAMYFVAENNQPVGPLTIDEVNARIKSGSVNPRTLVWKQGTPNWVPALDLPDLKGSFPPAQ